MKNKILPALLCVCLLLLPACQSREPQESPTPAVSPSQTAETPPAPTVPVPETPTPSAEPTPDKPQFPAFLTELALPRVDALVTTGGSMQFITAWLTEEELAELKSAIAMDTWWVADDVPAMGLDSSYILYDEEGHSLLITDWDEGKCLILAKADSESYLYYAPPAVLEAFENYLASKNFLPDFVRYFEMDQVEIDRTPNDRGEGYKDFDVYLLDDTEQLALLRVLSPDTWTVAAGEELGVMYTEALRASDPSGNRLNIAPWDGEKCLVSCFFADGAAVVRYWAPASVLEDALTFTKSHAPLGTIDTAAAYYYDLFWADPGFDALLALGDPSGRISDDQMAAYALIRVAYDSYFDSETGITRQTMDTITKEHFGRTIKNYDNSMSKTLPSGNITATGWDIGGSCHLVLSGTPDQDEYGNITAAFLVYTLGEDVWIDGTLAPVLLNHAREYMLTGRVSEYPKPQTISVTFRIEPGQGLDGVQIEYLVYDAVRVTDPGYSAG